MTHLIYLAAGKSSRFGENKLLYPLCGMPIYRHTLDRLLQLTKERTDTDLLVVTRHEEILDYVREIAQANNRVRAVFSPDSVHGMSYTIRAAIQALAPLTPTDYLLFVVADQPYLHAETVTRMLDATANHPLCATVVYGEQVGNPTMFSAALVSELTALSGDRGGRAVLRAHDADCLRISCVEARELCDIDTMQDL